MSTSFQISTLFDASSCCEQGSKKGFRSSTYNNYFIEVVGFEGEIFSIEIEARTAGEAGAIAESEALAAGMQISYCNVYEIH